jgi:hypothetical protein
LEAIGISLADYPALIPSLRAMSRQVAGSARMRVTKACSFMEASGSGAIDVGQAVVQRPVQHCPADMPGVT